MIKNISKKKIIHILFFLFGYMNLSWSHEINNADNIHYNFISQCYEKISEAKKNKSKEEEQYINQALSNLIYAQISTSDFYGDYIVFIDSKKPVLYRSYYFSKDSPSEKKKFPSLYRGPEVVCFFKRQTDSIYLAQWKKQTFSWEDEKSQTEQKSVVDKKTYKQFLEQLDYKSYPLYRFMYKKNKKKWMFLEFDIKETVLPTFKE